MKIINKTRGTIITNETIIPTSIIDESLGLLRHKAPTAMLFRTRFGLHTFFMKYAIDILILDKENNIAALKENLIPNQIYLWNPKHNTAIELPPGTIKKTKTKPGDKIQMKKEILL